MSDKVLMTAAGHTALKAKLALLKAEMPKVSQEIGVAREHGDLRENAEYHAAKEKQGMLHAEIVRIESQLADAEVVDISKIKGDKVAFGATIKLLNVETEEEVVYQVVGPAEADMESGKISYEAPLARQLMGRRVGDEVKVKTPKGEREYEVLDVSFA
jgi:transcription elongation factor GreA